MERAVIRNKRIKNNRGVTLVEVMISLVILLVVFMGLLQASMLSIDQNLRNVIRDEAVRVASDHMVRARSVPFASLDPITPVIVTEARMFRSLSQNFTVTRTVSNVGTDNRQVTIRVAYTYRGEPSSYDIVSLVRNK